MYPGASPYIYPARTTQGHWDTLVRCTLALPIPTRRVGIILEYDNNHTYSIVHARKRHLSHRDRSTRCSQFPIFNCKPFQLNTCLYRQSLRFFLLFNTMSSAASRAASIVQGMYRVAWGDTSNAAVPTVGWIQPQKQCTSTHRSFHVTRSPLPYTLRGHANICAIP